MNQVTLRLPDTLYHQLESLANQEGVDLTHYLLYLLTRQVATTYTVQVLSPEEVAQQETDYTNLLQTWQTASTSKIEEILATRELVEPEPELRPEIVAKLKQKISLRQTP
jgi:hypothetical protein